jgi:uncharacterized protein
VLRVVLDTNIFVSSLLVKSGVPAQVLDTWRGNHYVLVVSPPLIAELRSTLSYPRIRRKYGIMDGDVERLIGLLQHDAILVSGVVDVTGAVPDDPKDEMILACALEGRADLIVSGDKHLLDLGNYRGVSIITARHFMQLMDRTLDQ